MSTEKTYCARSSRSCFFFKEILMNRIFKNCSNFIYFIKSVDKYSGLNFDFVAEQNVFIMNFLVNYL